MNETVGADLKVRMRVERSELHKGHQPKPGEDMSWRDPMTSRGRVHDKHLPAEMKVKEALTDQVTKELA